MCARIFSTNDTHGRLLAAAQSWSGGRLVGGSAAIAGYLREVRESTRECPVFVVSGGDIMQGTLISNLTDGASTIRAFNAIGYDVAAIGNHEFDWGVDVLRQRVDEAQFAMLGANIYEKATGEHPAWVRPWTIVERRGIRVGFIGMTTLSTPTSSRPINVVDFEFRSISETLDRYIPEVRAEGVDFVVAVMHEGAFCDSAGECHGAAVEALAATSERFDYAVTGHSHSRVEDTVRGAPVVQSYANSTAFGLGRLDRDAAGVVTARLVGITQTYADEIEPDAEIATLVEGFRAKVAGVADREITVLAAALPKPRRGGFALGRLIADAQRAKTGTQVAMMNNGDIRRPLPAGPVTYETLFELQPFANRLVTLRLSGADLRAAVEHAIHEDGVDSQLSGMRARYDASAPRGSRLVSLELLDGTPVSPTDTYSVTVNDFMATGGGGYTMFLDAEEAVETGVIDLDALIEYLDAQPRPLTAPGDPRWLPVGR